MACIPPNLRRVGYSSYTWASRWASSVTPILQHDPVSRIRYVSAYPYPYPILRYTFVPFKFCRNFGPILIRLSVSVLHSIELLIDELDSTFLEIFGK